jgi:hypothetical protein
VILSKHYINEESVMKYFTSTLLAIIAISATALAGELTLDGRSFSATLSRNAGVQGQACLLAGNFSFGAAVYELAVPPGTDQAGVEVEFENLRGKWLRLYVYNYGPGRDDEAVRNRRIDPAWRLWQATDGGGVWKTSNPELIKLRPGDGRTDYLGPQNKLRILLYAHGGVPYIGDARFLIKRVSLVYPDGGQAGLQEIKDKLVTSEKAWIEGDFLLVWGVGLPPKAGDEKPGRIAAIRAAKVVAYRNLAAALGRISPAGGTTLVPPNKVRTILIKPDGSAEVLLEVRLGDIK